MNTSTTSTHNGGWLLGLRDAAPLLGGYIPVAISFGLIAIQSGLSPLQAILVSLLVYAGASQFMFVGLLATGAPMWLVVSMSLLINLRHLVYAPNLAPWLTRSRWWPWLMHGLTDQIFALAHNRLPQLEVGQRLGWYSGAALLAWGSWVVGTAVGAITGDWLMSRWPLVGQITPFALPALFLVLLAPRITDLRWSLSLATAMLVAMLLALSGLSNVGIPLAAICGALCFYLIKARGSHHV
ncbi:AzlC family ABC transporter permease [Halomonas huangheensis]|uniref:Branched-chain amino acid permease n=1 Tax=Halomonas huangheensis TaxID=1178482 RepID=W1N8W4_9GAMM|nr:AzlC family ABC transporter permease [Halomonas huangheensis]ALM53088.1 branched-chain amino acid permease [Halomonas huangheensis]ERL51345.1 hypothetical protein BJB45_14230 [Halomonas huangheensis]